MSNPPKMEKELKRLSEYKQRAATTRSNGMPTEDANILHRRREHCFKTGIVTTEMIRFTQRQKSSREIDIEDIKNEGKEKINALVRHQELLINVYKTVGREPTGEEVFVLPGHTANQVFTDYTQAVDDIHYFGKSHDVVSDTFIRLRQLVMEEFNTEAIAEARKIADDYQIEYRLKMWAEGIRSEAQNIIQKVIEKQYEI